MPRSINILLVYVVFLSGCASLSQQTTPALTPLVALAEFPFSGDLQKIIIPVEWEGEHYSFLLDTGSNFTLFDTSLKHKLTGQYLFRIHGKDSAGRYFSAEQKNAPNAFVGSLNLKECSSIALLDLTSLRSTYKQDIDGILGMDFLRRYIVQIDFGCHKIIFFKRTSESNLSSFFHSKKDRHPEWGQAVPLRLGFDGLPYVQGCFSSQGKADFIIDTGYSGACNGGDLNEKLWARITPKLEWRGDRHFSTFLGPVSLEDQKVAVVEMFEVGPLVYNYLVFQKDRDSILGLGFLSHHRVTLDFPNRTLYLKKQREVQTTVTGGITLKGLEFSVACDKGQIIVRSIVSGGPAEKAGLREGDELAVIHDQNVAGWSMVELYFYLHSISKKGRHLNLHVKREGCVLELSIKRKE
ncbi:MAG: aspartyl protease family protein [Sedimentisphaerales bacterium]|nr:aspartyl protease family protein [Sedimentisphaerales bacterium]